VLKSFEFVSQLRRASAVVRQFGAPWGDIFVKGAPECMKDICRADSRKLLDTPCRCEAESVNVVPTDFDDLLAYYTHRGYRVIACATKRIPKLNWVRVQRMKRSEAESDLDFVGFIVFENKLKPTTTGVIDELSFAGIRKVMCTGDNILTAISVARECNLINPTAQCFVPHFHEGMHRTIFHCVNP
jgi:cation-transporting ATPase 13A2